MEDVLSVYQRPHDPKRPQVCLDEISKALRSTPRGELSLQPGQPKREDYEYQRHGTCALFLAVEPLSGSRHVWVRARRTKLDFAQVLRGLVDDVYPDAERIVLVVDNLNIHRPSPSSVDGVLSSGTLFMIEALVSLRAEIARQATPRPAALHRISWR